MTWLSAVISDEASIRNALATVAKNLLAEASDPKFSLDVHLPTPFYVKFDAGHFGEARAIKFALMVIVTTEDKAIEQFKTEAPAWAKKVRANL